MSNQAGPPKLVLDVLEACAGLRPDMREGRYRKGHLRSECLRSETCSLWEGSEQIEHLNMKNRPALRALKKELLAAS